MPIVTRFVALELIVLLVTTIPTDASRQSTKAASASDLPHRAPNKQIQPLVSEVSASQIETTVRKLAGFETRHTLSETESDSRGIGAARRWIKSEFDRYSRESGGRLQVALDEFEQRIGGRQAPPVRVVNVAATLIGTQPESRDRIYVVSAHYDS